MSIDMRTVSAQLAAALQEALTDLIEADSSFTGVTVTGYGTGKVTPDQGVPIVLVMLQGIGESSFATKDQVKFDLIGASARSDGIEAEDDIETLWTLLRRAVRTVDWALMTDGTRALYTPNQEAASGFPGFVQPVTVEVDPFVEDEPA